MYTIKNLRQNKHNPEEGEMGKVNTNIQHAPNYHLIPVMPVEEIDKRIVNYTRIGDEKQLIEFLKSIFADWEKQGITIDAAKGIACRQVNEMNKIYSECGVVAKIN